MMTSGQIAGMMGQQNQYFAGASAYSQQISQQMPGPYGGGASPTYAQVPGGIPQQAGFSYGGAGVPGAATARASGGIVSAMGGAAQFGLGAASIGAGFGMMGRVGGMALDPFVGGGMGWKAGAAMSGNMGMFGKGAMRLGMGAVGMLPAAGVLAAGSHMIGSTMAGAQEQAQVERVLSNQRMGGAIAGGGGFNKQASKSIGDMMRGMQELPEMMTSMSELTRIMDKMGQMGAMSGTQNVAEFKTKFKQNIKLLKDMSKVMSTSMEEALPMFGEIKRSGFYSTGDILKNAMNRQLTGGLSGMNQTQVNQVAQYGAQVNWQQGGTLASGSKHALRVAGQLGSAKSLGLLSEEQITEATGGIGGSEGLQMMSQRMTGLAHKMARGSIGLATSVALGAKDKSGRFTGEMDEALMARYNAGEFSFRDIKRMANKAKQGSAAVQSWATNKSAMRASLASGMGVEGTTRMLQNALGDRGFDSPDHMRLLAQRFGMSERDTNTYLPLMQKMPEIMGEMRSRNRAQTKALARQSFMKENYSWDAVKTKAKKRISNIVTEPFKKFGSDLRQSVNETVDDFIDELTGEYEVEVTKGMSTLAQGALSGEKTSMLRMSKMMKSSGFMSAHKSGMGGDFTRSRMSAAMDWASGRDSAGEQGLSLLKAMGAQTYTGSKRGLRGRGITTLDEDFNVFAADEFTGVRADDIATISSRMRELGGGQLSDRQRSIQNVLKRSGKAGGNFMSQLGKTAALRTDIRELSGGEGIMAWDKQLSKADASAIQEGMGAAGLSGVSSAELAMAGLSLRGEDTSAIRAQLRSAGKSLGGLSGGFGTKKHNADRIDALKRELRKDIEGKGGDYDRIKAVLDAEGSDGNIDMLLGEGGLLSDIEGGEFGMMGTYDGNTIRAREFALGEGSRARGVHSAMRELAKSEEYGDYSGARAVARNAADTKGSTSRLEFGTGVLQNMGSKYLQSIRQKGSEKALGHFYRNLSSAEKKVFNANKQLVKGEATKQRLSLALQHIAGGGNVSSKEKEALSDAGFDLSNMDQATASQYLAIQGDVGSGKIDAGARKKLGELRKRMWSEGTTQMMEDISEEGRALKDRVSAGLGAAEDVGLEVGDEAKALLNRVSGAGGRMEAAGEGSEEALALMQSGGLGFGDMARELEGLSARDRKFVLGTGGDQLGFAYSARKRTTEALRRAGAGRGGKRDVKLGKMFSAEAFAGMDAGQRQQIMDIVGDDKIISAGEEQEALKQFMSEKASSKTMAAAGITTKNAGANPADIANSMTTFVGATNQLAKFVQSMVTGEATTDGKPK